VSKLNKTLPSHLEGLGTFFNMLWSWQRCKYMILSMNGPVECCRIPPIRQKKGEWMGHGAFVGEPALVHL
jgi:hypothetical protein